MVWKSFVYLLDQLCSMLSVHVFPLSNIEERSFAQVKVLRHVLYVIGFWH